MLTIRNIHRCCLAVAAALALLGAKQHVQGFIVSPGWTVRATATTSSSVWAAGMGISVNASKNKKNGGKTVNKKKTTPVVIDIKASLLRHEKLYDQLLVKAATRNNEGDDDEDEDESTTADNNNQQLSTTEYVVAVRDKTRKNLDDWIPFGHLVLCSNTMEEKLEQQMKQACVTLYCRELAMLAEKGAKALSLVARQDMEYSLEPIDSFQKHVYDVVVATKDKDMTVQQALEIMQIQDTDMQELDMSTVKRQYRRLAFEHHPDRHDLEEDKAMAGQRYDQLQQAFERLTQSGTIRKQGSSWYESLGGRARTDFSAVQLISASDAQRIIDTAVNIHQGSAVTGMDPEIVQAFIARSKTISYRSN